ncbi:MAG: ABC transporter permease, partial [Terriglobales bacterium]
MAPNWRQFVEQRLPAEAAVQAELAEQLEEIYAAALAEGTLEPEARRVAENHISDWPALAHAIAVSRTPIQARLPLRVRLALSLAGFGRDLRQSGRSLRHARGFSLAAIATLALGIGLCLALFGLTDALVLRPLPVPQPQRLMALLETSRQFPQMAVDWPDFQDWTAANHNFTAMAAVRGTLQILVHQGPSTTVSGLRISPAYFSLLGARPALGRLLQAGDDRGADVVVVSWDFFQTRLAGEPAWIGRQLDLDGRSRTLVGVTAPGFPGLTPGSDPEFWEPLAPFIARNPAQQKRGRHNGIFVLARLRPGVTESQARAEMDVNMRALARQFPDTNAGVTATMQPLPEFLRGSFSSTLLLLLAAGGVVLVIACLNVVNLFLARTAQRARDLDVRLA